MKRIALLLLSCLSTMSLVQGQRVCGAMEHHEHLLSTDPSYAENRAKEERNIEQWIAKNPNGTRAVVTIPVVVHVVYNTTAQNVSQAQIQSQLDVLNADYRKLNADVSLVPSAFASLAADCEVQFCLAQRDPNGNATTGVERRQTTVTSFSTNDAVKKYSQGGLDAWNSSQYLNLWVCNLSGGVLGYAQFPGGAAATDGVVITYTGFGTTGTAAAPFNKGRTATHEVGHWLNLYHIWGDDGTACTGSDQVADTPNQADENYGCPSFPQVSCSNGANGDMFMNYMDYTDDACMYMFTAGQKARMVATLNGSRAGLATSLGCQAPTGGTTCATPSGLTAGSITTSGATLTWAAVSGATSYNVQYKTSAATTWTTVTSTTTSRALTGLAAGTAYNAQVQAVCGTTGTSAYSAAITFTTTSTAPACSDNYETNNTLASAKAIPVNTTISARIGTSSDKDYFSFANTAAASKIKVTLSNLPADYDLKLYSPSGTLLGTSQNGGTTSEVLIYNSTTVGTYKAYVYGYSSAFNATLCYNLRADISSTNFVRLADEEEDGIKALIEDLVIAPNPTNGIARLTMDMNEDASVEFLIFDQMGRTVRTFKQNLTTTENSFEVDFSDFASGVYFLQANYDGIRATQKIVVTK